KVRLDPPFFTAHTSRPELASGGFLTTVTPDSGTKLRSAIVMKFLLLEQKTFRTPGAAGSQNVELVPVSGSMFVPACIVIVPGASGHLVTVTVPGSTIVCVSTYVSCPIGPRSKNTVQLLTEAALTAVCKAVVESDPDGVQCWSVAQFVPVTTVHCAATK